MNRLTYIYNDVEKGCISELSIVILTFANDC